MKPPEHLIAGIPGPLAAPEAGEADSVTAATGLPATWAWWAVRALSTQQRVLAGRAASLRAPLLQLTQQVRGSMLVSSSTRQEILSRQCGSAGWREWAVPLRAPLLQLFQQIDDCFAFLDATCTVRHSCSTGCWRGGVAVGATAAPHAAGGTLHCMAMLSFMTESVEGVWPPEWGAPGGS